MPSKGEMENKKTIKNRLSSLFAQEFFHSGVVHWTLISAILLNAASWGALAYFIRPVDFPIILHYNVYFGVDLIGDWWQAYFLPLIGLSVLLINLILGYVFYSQKDRIVAHILLLTATVVQVIITIALIGIIRINY